MSHIIRLEGEGLDSHEGGAPASASEAPRIAISLNSASKVYGHGADAVVALDRISLEVPRGQFVSILGPSGCGKSTLLSIIAGLDPLSAGWLDVDGGRPALMFQEPALLPWLTVALNVELPLRLRRIARADREWEVERLLRLVNLENFARKRPHELSGGMRQRVAMARALAQNSEVLLMDEPFGALDAITRDVLHEDLTRIWQETGNTIVFVTHNVREAVRLGDRVVLLKPRPGRVARQWWVDVPRPRRIETQEVSSLADHITEHLREEIRSHGRS